MSKKIQMQRTRAHGKAGLAFGDTATTQGTVDARQKKTKKVLISLPVRDVTWLKDQVEQCPRRLGVQLSQSEIVHLALELVRCQKGGLAGALEVVRPKDI